MRAETSVKTKRKIDTVGVGRRRRRYHEHVNDAALRGSYVDDYGALRSLAAPDGGDAPDAPRMAAPPDVAESPLAASLFEVVGVESIFLAGSFITVTKSEASDWTELAPPIVEAIKAWAAEGGPALGPERRGAGRGPFSGG